jgi:ribosomal protein S6--L-glutamate ligase
VAEKFLLGWEEWLALPDLGLAAIKAKIDTGARTSALHAFSVEPFGPAANSKVRFAVHPVPGRDDIAVECIADVIDRREVTSSNGEREMRFVIRTRIAMGGREWPIEVTLANRETMAYRMLLGRQAILDDMFVDPASSFLQPRLSYRVYGGATRLREAAEQRPLALALLTRRPENATNRRIARAAERRGHIVTTIDRTRLSLYIDAREPAIFLDGRPIARPDAAIVRAGRTLNAFSLAIVRQMQALGAYAISSADALARAGEPLALRQTLAMGGVAVPDVAVSHADLMRGNAADSHVLADSLGLLAAGPLLRFAVVGGRALAAIERDPVSALEDSPEWRATDAAAAAVEAPRVLAERAAATLGLGLAAVDVVRTRQGPLVVDVTANMSITLFERLTGAALVEAMIVHIEQEVRGRGRAQRQEHGSE